MSRLYQTKSERKENCGSYSEKNTLSDAYEQYIISNSGTTHMVIIFNIFVIYTLFNQINCRVIDDSFNIFQRINKSPFFPLITLLEMGLQVLIIFLGNSPFHIVHKGLTGNQWGICIGFSAITFVVSIIGKCIPIDKALDKCLAPKETEKVTDTVSSKIIEENNAVNINVNNDNLKAANKVDNEETEDDIISEKININMFKYDFNNCEQDIISIRIN